MTLWLDAVGIYRLYIHPFTVPLPMKFSPFFLVGLALFLRCGAAAAQTTPAPRPNPAKAGARPVGAAALPRPRFARAYKLDTAAFRRSGRPADGIQRLAPVKK